jgi:hypothetical protein
MGLVYRYVRVFMCQSFQIFLEQFGDFIQYFNEMPESRNSGIGSEVDFLGNELMRQLHDNS